MKSHYFLVLGMLVCFKALAQNTTDSSKAINLGEIKVSEQRYKFNALSLPDYKGTYLYTGKKTTVINILGLDHNVAEKTPRQIFAKVPGVFVYDMDGSGNQMNISTRGLDPHRGWEFNVRKDGVITNTDIYGYPASHYSMPVEAMQNIELVRGTGSLQYGQQFGGMLNYVSKTGDSTQKIKYEGIHSIGSFGLLSTYHAIGGQVGKLNYYIYYNKRLSNGFRENSKTDFNAYSAVLQYRFNEKLDIKLDFSKSKYVIQLAGPVNDSMFYANPRGSTRERNYYSPNIYVPSVSLNFQASSKTKFSWVSSAVLGSRNSVMFDKTADIIDKIDSKTLQYANRQVDIDHYQSYTNELRMIHFYSLGKIKSILVGGIQYMNNDLHRRQLGKGTTGTNYDLSITGDWGRNLHFKTQNVAVFFENRFSLGQNLTLSPGFRLESGQSKMLGVISYYDSGKFPDEIEHKFPLFGISGEYKLGKNQKIYSGISQAFRPVIFKDIIPSSTFEKSDDNLKDAYGYNFELGYNAEYDNLKIELTYFQLLYKNRLGTLAQYDEAGNFQILRTNIGTSLTRGLESFVEYFVKISNKANFSVFTSTALMDARYQKATVRAGEKNVDISGNYVESTPRIISRNGVTIRHYKTSLSILYSYTAQSYADALNTVKPSLNGSVGLVPSYGIVDLNGTYRISKGITLKANLNNALNKMYFTKRPQFYPGPGIWTSDGRGFSMTLSTVL